MEKIRTHLLATAAVVALGSAAYAADMGMPLKAPPLPPPVQDWSGVYVGLEGGYGWGKQSFNPAFDPFFNNKYSSSDPYLSIFDPTLGSVSQSGGVFGGTAGVQKQYGSVVLGLAASVDWANIKGSDTVTNIQTFCSPNCSDYERATLTINQSQSMSSKIDELAYVGPKLGWAFSPNWMVYVTGGAAWAHKEDDGSAFQTDTFSYFCDNDLVYSKTYTAQNASFTGSVSMFGYAVGGGLDYKWQLDPGSAVILGIQYLHYGFGNNALVLADNQFGSGDSFGINTKESVDVIKGSISYFFSIH